MYMYIYHSDLLAQEQDVHEHGDLFAEAGMVRFLGLTRKVSPTK